MWRIFGKKNRNYTIAGVIAFVIAVYVVYSYVLPESWAAWFRSFVTDPTTASFETSLHSQAKRVRGWQGAGTKDSPLRDDPDPIFSN